MERRLRFRLGRFSNRIIDAPVTITKLKGSNGRFNIRCCIQVRIRGSTQVVVEEVEKNPHLALDRAVDRARRAVARKLDRRRD